MNETAKDMNLQHKTEHAPPVTAFAPAERAGPEELTRQHRLFVEAGASAILDAVGGLALVLNRQRQVIFINRAMLDLLGLDDGAALLGQRPGDILGCDNASRTSGGCGTTEACQYCSAVLTILKAITGTPNEGECRILSKRKGRSEAHDLKVKAAPLEVAGEPFVVFTIQDVSHEKRRRILERIFFHDIMNTAGSLAGLVECLAMETEGEARETAELVHVAVGKVLDEINGQRELSAAENGDLEANPDSLKILDLLESVRETFDHADVRAGRELVVDSCDEDLWMVSDFTLLRRVLTNMVKNALEASPRGGTVRMSCAAERGLDGRDMIRFAVANSGRMSDEVKAQVFQRSFSTKGHSRGLGTYSIKLLTEAYLGGRAAFTSDEEQGTVFHIVVPAQLPKAEPARG